MPLRNRFASHVFASVASTISHVLASVASTTPKLTSPVSSSPVLVFCRWHQLVLYTLGGGIRGWHHGVASTRGWHKGVASWCGINSVGHQGVASGGGIMGWHHGVASTWRLLSSHHLGGSWCHAVDIVGGYTLAFVIKASEPSLEHSRIYFCLLTVCLLRILVSMCMSVNKIVCNARVRANFGDSIFQSKRDLFLGPTITSRILNKGWVSSQSQPAPL